MSKEIKDFANFDLQNEENFEQIEVGDYFIDKNGRKCVIAEKDMIRDFLGNGIRHKIFVVPMRPDTEFTTRQLATRRPGGYV